MIGFKAICSSKVIFCLWIGVLCLTSCAVQSEEAKQQANQLWEHPEPRPDYIWVMENHNGYQCFEIFLGFFADTQFAPPDINLQELMDKLAFIVDGNPASVESIGNSRNTLEACFSIQGLGEGLHVASMTLTKFSGLQDSYAWAFQVTRESSGVSVSLPPLVLTPSPTHMSQ